MLVDTGMGSDPEVDAHYRPHRRSLGTALAAVGRRLDEVTTVVNCHLHFDHCGGNPELVGRPIVVQRDELAAARQPGYTLPWLVEGLHYVELDGEAELAPGVLVVPTPGHAAGHQSLVVRGGDGTVVVVAGQSHDTASEYAADAAAVAAVPDGRPLPVPHAWMDRLLQLDPSRVVFAHVRAVWEP